jgi:C-terminal processing protease CtpA/Prc
MLGGATSSQTNPVPPAAVTKAVNFPGGTAYLRISQVAGGLDNAIRHSLDQLASTQKLAGIVLDLRYTGGDDYQAVADTLDAFVKSPRPLIDWGQGVINAKAKTDAITLPIAALINAQTAGAAEALAAGLRETGAGLLLGTATAGRAMVAREFRLPGGEVLRIGTGQVRVGTNIALTPKGVSPDIAVQVPPGEEQLYYSDPYRAPNASRGSSNAGTNTLSTNLARRFPRNEAELVRERREGANWDPESSRAARAATELPQVTDPVLARALDIVKGLALVRRQS